MSRLSSLSPVTVLVAVFPILSILSILSILPCACSTSPPAPSSSSLGDTGVVVDTGESGEASVPSDGAADGDVGYAPPPSTLVVEPGIVREILLVDGVVPEANPVRHVSTPPEQNRVRVVRYRVDSTPPKPARAIVVLMPGFLGGAGSFDPLARALVRRAASDPDGAIEAWAIDRRSNLLEDTHGDDVAEVRRDTRWAYRYYADLEAIEGKTFAGFLDTSQAPWMSEWGLPVTIGDLHNVIAKVPAADRKSRVILAGHSLGATIVESYAAWDFSGARGFDELAGLVLIDGVGRREGAAVTAFDRESYETKDSSMGGFTSPALAGIRKSTPFVVLPLLGVGVLENAERVAVGMAIDPTAPRPSDDDVSRSFSLLFGLDVTALPMMTNRAAFGFAFDSKSCGITIAAVSAGEATGGPTAKYDSLFGAPLLHPSDPHGSYDWRDFDQTTPPGHTRLAELANAWFSGPGLNFSEWYFPTRLALDAQFAASLVIADDDWRATYGLRAKHGAEIDLPLFAFAAQLTTDAADATDPKKPRTAHGYDALAALLAKNPIGGGRPNAGTPRTDPKAFSVRIDPSFTHIDPLMAADTGDGAAWFDAIAAFVKANTTKGGVVIARE
jgi:hypothetical protein